MNLECEEIICDKCNGLGTIEFKTLGYALCTKCYGYKKLNWLENIFGKNTDFFNMDFGNEDFTVIMTSNNKIEVK